MTDFDVPSENEIHDGYVTDQYFVRTEDALEYSGENPRVVAEVTADQFETGEYEVFGGVKDAAELLDGLPVDVDALHEGFAFDGGPVMRIEGDYADFARYETALLGFLSHASGIATAAREVVQASGDTPVYSFGTRHVHPMLAIAVERNAYIAGMDGFSNVAAELDLPDDASGTMPHALMLAHGKGNQEEAWQAFNKSAPDEVPRIILADTFTDESDEVLRAARILGDDLDAVRLDTTGSRRGSFEHIIKEVRYKLKQIDRDDVDIFVSGGLGPEDLRDLREHVDGFGVGSYVSNADPVDFSLDIVERNGEPITKRGKLGGVKSVYRDADEYITGDAEHVVRESESEAELDDDILVPLIQDGEVVREFDVEQAQSFCNLDCKHVGFRGGA